MSTFNNTTLPNTIYVQSSATTSSNPFVHAFEPRDPTSADIQYPIQKQWLNTVANRQWELKGFTSNNGQLSAVWVKTGSANDIESVTVDTYTAPGTNPVVPNSAFSITVTGGQTAPGTISNVIQTNSLAPNTFTVQIQQTSLAATVTPTLNGVAHFNSSQFTNNQGFISLASGGGTIDSIMVDASTSPGTNPVLSNAGLITITGNQVAAGTINPHVIRTDSLAANTFTIEIQRSQAVATSTIGDNGVSHFNSTMFSVDSNGFVSLSGGGQAVDSFQVDTFTAPGTNPVIPSSAGLVIVTGGQVAAGTTTNVIQTDSLAANSYTIQIQRSSSQASSTVGANGVSHYNNAQFIVDSNAFVSINPSGLFPWTTVSSNFSIVAFNGYIATGAITGTLPSSPNQGDTVAFIQQFNTTGLTIQAVSSQVIVMNSGSTSPNGAVSVGSRYGTATFVYSSFNNTWTAVSFTGAWNI